MAIGGVDGDGGSGGGEKVARVHERARAEHRQDGSTVLAVVAVEQRVTQTTKDKMDSRKRKS